MKQKLDAATEKKLRSLGNRRFALVLTLTVLWPAAVIAGWILLSRAFGRSVWSPSTMLTLCFSSSFIGRITFIDMQDLFRCHRDLFACEIHHPGGIIV